jgi:hypothetical protein
MTWTCQHTTRFARAYRFTLGDRLQRQLHGVLELPLRAKFSRQRVELPRAANLELELLRFAFRLAKDLRCLSLDSYGHAARTVNEIGQMVGGWLKASAGGRAEP